MHLEKVDGRSIGSGTGSEYERCRYCGYIRATIPERRASEPEASGEKKAGRPRMEGMVRTHLSLDKGTVEVLESIMRDNPGIDSISSAIRFLAGEWKKERRGI